MADVLTQHNNDARTGANLNETALTPDKLKLGKFGKLCFRVVDGNPYAQPLYASHIPIKDIGPRNVVIIATEHNSVFAFDADDTDQNSTTALLWKSDSLGPSVPSEVLSSRHRGRSGRVCRSDNGDWDYQHTGYFAGQDQTVRCCENS